MAPAVLVRRLWVRLRFEFFSREKRSIDVGCPPSHEKHAGRCSRTGEDGLRGRRESQHAGRRSGDGGGSAERSSSSVAGRDGSGQEGNSPPGSRPVAARKEAV